MDSSNELMTNRVIRYDFGPGGIFLIGEDHLGDQPSLWINLSAKNNYYGFSWIGGF